MALQCNIDARGRSMRTKIGVVLLALSAAAALVWALPSGAPAAWVVAGALAVFGVFSLVQAKLGWCAARAAGIRVPY